MIFFSVINKQIKETVSMGISSLNIINAFTTSTALIKTLTEGDPLQKVPHREHELGGVQEVVGLAVELHRLQGLVLLQQMRRVLGQQGLDLLHVVGLGQLHSLVPLREAQQDALTCETDAQRLRSPHRV